MEEVRSDHTGDIWYFYTENDRRSWEDMSISIWRKNIASYLPLLLPVSSCCRRVGSWSRARNFCSLLGITEVTFWWNAFRRCPDVVEHGHGRGWWPSIPSKWKRLDLHLIRGNVIFLQNRVSSLLDKLHSWCPGVCSEIESPNATLLFWWDSLGAIFQAVSFHVPWHDPWGLKKMVKRLLNLINIRFLIESLCLQVSYCVLAPQFVKC